MYRSLKAAWHNECAKFTTMTGLTPTKNQFFRLLAPAWKAALTDRNIKSGFKACGLYPFDPSAIPAEAFTPAGRYIDLLLCIGVCDVHAWECACVRARVCVCSCSHYARTRILGYVQYLYRSYIGYITYDLAYK